MPGHQAVIPTTDTHYASVSCNDITPGSLEHPRYQEPITIGHDFLLYPDEDMEEPLGLQCVTQNPTTSNSYLSASPDSFSGLEDALGSPIMSSVASGRSQSPQPTSSPAEDLNALAERRLREDDEGKRRRKLSASTTKRPRVQKKTASERRKTGIKRPRQPSLFCRWEGCGKTFTRQREFEMHMGKHEKPLFSCEICGQLLTRKDNRKKHDESKRHRENLAALQAKLANSPAHSSSSSSSSSSSGSSASHPSSNPSPTVSTSSSLTYFEATPPLFDQLPPHPVVGNQHTLSDFLPFNTQDKMLILQAKIAALGERHEALNSELREVMQEMETIRREA
ncbi:hypothetical protein TWF281_007501 [Arthrobotrys megalospora]